MEGSTAVIIVAQVLGLISWLLLLYSYTMKDIDDLLFIQIFVAAFDVASYLLLGADAGMLICLVELIKSILYYKTDKDKQIFKFGIICYILIGILTVDHWYACLPVLGSLIDSYGTARDSKSANIASIVSNILWVIYDLIILSYIGAINDFIVILCNVGVLFFGYSRLLRISKFRITRCNYLNKKTVNQIYELDLKNYGKDNLWNKDYQMDVFKKNSDSMFLIKYKNDLVGYINYLNITKEEYDKIKLSKKIPDSINIDRIIEFKKNKKAYVLIDSININKQYENDKAVELIDRKIKSFIKMKKNRKIYIHGILGNALTDFEKNVYEHMEFKKIDIKDNDLSLYELNLENS